MQLPGRREEKKKQIIMLRNTVKSNAFLKSCIILDLQICFNFQIWNIEKNPLNSAFEAEELFDDKWEQHQGVVLPPAQGVTNMPPAQTGRDITQYWGEPCSWENEAALSSISINWFSRVLAPSYSTEILDAQGAQA